MKTASPGVAGRVARVGLMLVILWGTAGGASSSPAADAVDASARIVPGFRGALQVGRWTPIRVPADVAGDAAEATLTASDADGRPVDFPLQPRTDGGFTGLFQTGRLDASLRVTLSGPDGASRQLLVAVGGPEGLTPYRQSTAFWMVVGEHPGFDLAAQLLNDARRGSPLGPAVQLLPTPVEEVPTSATALESVGVLILGDLALTPAQAAAVQHWVLTGGRLVVTAGDSAASLAASPLATWLPVRIGPTYAEQQTDALCSRIAAYVPNKGGPLISLDKLQALRLEPTDGVTLISGPTAAVATRAAYGLGQVTVVGLQLNRAPFYSRPQGRPSDDARGADGEARIWGGLRYVCLQLAHAEAPRTRERAQEAHSQLTPTGVTDVQSQLMAVLDEFPDVRRPSSWNVIGLMVLYLILIGPIDYLLVHRLLRRPQLTWVTLPAWVLLAGWWSSTLANAGNAVPAAAQQLNVLDAAIDSGVQRMSSWMSLYSPETRRYTVSVQPEFFGGAQRSAGEVRLGPVARPDEGFRGMYRRGGLQLGGAGYALVAGEESASAVHAPVDQWSSLLFAATADGLAPADAPPLAEYRRDVDVYGAVVRQELLHRLPGELEDWFVVENLQVTYPLEGAADRRTLAPGRRYDLNLGCGQRLLKAYLQGELTSTFQRKTGQDTYIRAGVYDPLGRDPDRIFRTLSFFEAVGGTEYTRLTNVPLARLDFSEFIHLGRVIVCGRLSVPAARFDVDGQPAETRRPSTFVRLLVPVVQQVVDAPAGKPPRD